MQKKKKKKKSIHLSSKLALDIKLGLAPFHAKHKCWALLAKLSIEPLPLYGILGVEILSFQVCLGLHEGILNA